MTKETEYPYYNRELSWINFNYRVLEESLKKENPIMERVKFLSITASNLDEFLMVRVAGVKNAVESKQKKDVDGTLQSELLKKLETNIHEFMHKQYSCLHNSIKPLLAKNKIRFLKIENLNYSQKKFIDDYFSHMMYPVLTPLAIDASRPFPLLYNKSLNIAVLLESKKDKDDKSFAIVQAPSILQRFLEVPNENGERNYILIENIIIYKLNILFELYNIKAAAPFRITRDSDLEVNEEADDFMYALEKSIKKRKRGKPIRLEILQNTNTEIKKFLIKSLNILPSEIYEILGPIDLTFLMKFANSVDAENLHFKNFEPVFPPNELFGDEDIFFKIRSSDRLVFHPYESFSAVTDFIETAATDKNVLAIKQTLYRVSGNSPIISSLIKAADNGKQVTVLVELKARFDEENNIVWARKLEHAGCHVIYGLVGLKTHCKITLVVRKEDDGIRRYLHLATGNYNDSTAKIYTDLGLFTCNEQFGADASSLFNVITGYSKPNVYNKFLVAPHGMRESIKKLILNETENAKKHFESGITIKVNSLVDKEIINMLYDASNAGVKINLIVRGICCLIPQVKGFSENITVKSIVGRYLEHSRIFKFENCGMPKIFIGSADLMPRNLDRRIELIFPIEDDSIKNRIENILKAYLNDNTNSHIMQNNATYLSVCKRGHMSFSSQNYFATETIKKHNEMQALSFDTLLTPIHESNREHK